MPVSFDNGSTSAGAGVKMVLTIDSLPMDAVAGSSVELYLEDDFQVPGHIDRSAVYFTVSNPFTGFAQKLGSETIICAALTQNYGRARVVDVERKSCRSDVADDLRSHYGVSGEVRDLYRGLTSVRVAMYTFSAGVIWANPRMADSATSR